jgi:hypothetical protein
MYREPLSCCGAHFDGFLIRLDEAVEHFEQGGFARAIAPDEADAFAALQLKADVLVGPEFARAQRRLRRQESGVRSQESVKRKKNKETGDGCQWSVKRKMNQRPLTPDP